MRHGSSSVPQSPQPPGAVAQQTWQAFIEGPVYTHLAPPWHADPAFAVISEHPGLRDNIGGRITPVLTLAVELVHAMAGVDLLAVVHTHRPAQGLCLGFGMNALEPYDLLQGLALDRVHAYEWIAEQVIEAAQTLQTLRADDPLLPTRIRLHHGTISNLQAIANASIGVIYTANVFNWEIPMMPETFAGVIQEILRVLTDGGVLLSRGSAGILEEHLARHGRMMLSNQLVSVFQKQQWQANV